MRPEDPKPGLGPDGALVLHGLTGSCHSVQGLADALAGAGFSVELPLLPGHGTTPDDLGCTGWEDWLGAARAAYCDLARSCRRVIVAGLSMGGSLACRLASDNLDVAGLVVVNPFIDPPAASFRRVLRQMLDEGITRADGIAGDVADPSVREEGYRELPLASLLSLCGGLDDLMGRLGSIRCPVLLMTSRADHVVPTVSSDILAEHVCGPVERVWLERSYHVATLDHDRDEVEKRAVAFALAVVGGARTGPQPPPTIGPDA